MIYIISNVKYPKKNRIRPAPDDILVFINSATSAAYYLADPVVRFCFHRSPEADYGPRIPGCINCYIFDHGGLGYGIPSEFVEQLKQSYDWNYEIEPGKTRCMTTGYMTVAWIRHIYPEQEITLVNFGFEVKQSTYRCPWHNWRFEAEALKQYPHISTEA